MGGARHFECDSFDYAAVQWLRRTITLRVPPGTRATITCPPHMHRQYYDLFAIGNNDMGEYDAQAEHKFRTMPVVYKAGHQGITIRW